MEALTSSMPVIVATAPPDYRFRIYTSGQERRVTAKIKRQIWRRAAIEPLIGHLEGEQRMGRNTWCTPLVTPSTHPCRRRL
jgi:hypothetical protein